MRGRAATVEPVGIQGDQALASSDIGALVRNVAGARNYTDAHVWSADADHGAMAASGGGGGLRVVAGGLREAEEGRTYHGSGDATLGASNAGTGAPEVVYARPGAEENGGEERREEQRREEESTQDKNRRHEQTCDPQISLLKTEDVSFSHATCEKGARDDVTSMALTVKVGGTTDTPQTVVFGNCCKETNR